MRIIPFPVYINLYPVSKSGFGQLRFMENYFVKKVFAERPTKRRIIPFPVLLIPFPVSKTSFRLLRLNENYSMEEVSNQRPTSGRR